MKRRGNRLTHGYAGSKIYLLFKAMHNRCKRPATDSYKYYGAKGITVCERWEKFENFLADMGMPEAGHSLDRIDNTKGYSPDNCRWASAIEQANNHTNNRFVEVNGVKKTVAQWAHGDVITSRRIVGRLNRGWTPEDAVLRPAGSCGIPYRPRPLCHHESSNGRTCNKCGQIQPGWNRNSTKTDSIGLN